MMHEPELQRIEELFQAAADLPVEERPAFLARECESDPALRDRVEAMLVQMDQDETLEAPALAADTESAVTEGPGTVIDRYKLLQVIGEGGFGVVYMAEQQEPVVRKVALKIIKLGMDTREVVARFEAERQALAMMDHPSIAKVLDGGVTETGRPYFVMELVRGVSITEYCDTNNLPTQERLELFANVCQAVQHAHQKGVIHRDIKPSNVMVTLHDGQPVAKVIDFGIAKAMHTRLTEKTLFTAYQRFIGTPAYMSPEQAEMSGLDIDTRTDIYSLGVLLYELLTGSTPFDTASLLEAGLLEIQRILREEQPPRPSLRISTSANASSIANRRRLDAAGLSRRLRGDLDWIVMKALEKDRTRRYGAASDLAADIRRHLHDEPVLAGPPSATYRVRKFLARNRTAVATAALVALALIGGVIATSLALLEASRQRDAAQREARHAQVVTEFLVDNLELSDPEVALQPEVSVRTLLDRASSQMASRFADQPQAEAQIRATMGRAYESLGEQRLAELHLRRAVELTDQLGVFDPADFYETLWTLVGVLFRVQSHDAFVFVQRARRVGHDHIGTSHPELAATLDRFLAELDDNAHAPGAGMVEPARELFAETVRLANASLPPGDPLWVIVADSYMAAGYWLWYSPHEPVSEAFFAEALAIFERELSAGDAKAAETRGALVGVLNRAGKVAEAEKVIVESLEVMRRIYPAGSFNLAFNESMLGVNLVAQGRYAEAEPVLLASHEVILAQAVEEGHFYALDSFGRLIDLYEGWGRPQDAERYRTDFAERVATSVLGAGWPIARMAFGDDLSGVRDGLDRLQALTGGVSYAARPGKAHSPDLGSVLSELIEHRRESLADDEPVAIIYARNLLGFANTLDPAAAADSQHRMAEEAAQILLQVSGLPDQLEAATALALLAETSTASPALARRQARQAWDLIRDSQEPDSWHRANAKVRIGRCFVGLGLLSEAEALLLPAHDVLRAQLGTDNIETLEARAQVLALLRRVEQAGAGG